MLHWVKSFALVAFAAAPFALGGMGAVAAIAAAVFVLFLALAALALLTGAFGRGRDGLYSAESAVAVMVLCVAAAWGIGHVLDGDVQLALRALARS